MNRFWKVLILCVFLLFCCSLQSFAKSKISKRSPKKEIVTAESAILVDITKNKILYSKRIHKRYEPASTVKILTALLALEELGAKFDVEISQKASQTQPSKVWLETGAIYNSLDLIKAVLIASANDASLALAEAVAVTEEQFANKMTKKAVLLGAKNSNFANASGLSAKNQYTTAYDLYRIVKIALENPVIYQIMKKKKEDIIGSPGREITLTNHNKLLFKMSYPLVLVKTGYTKSAKHCYAGIVYFGKKKYAIAILKSRNPWKDIESLIKLIKK